jgi:hypothetical protein
MISAVRDLVEARARLAQVSRELRGVEGEKAARRRYVR